MKKTLSILTLTAIALVYLTFNTKTQLPVIAIANYGPHASLHESIQGFKSHMQANGYIENKTIQYKILDVGFDPALIPQMITTLKQHNPKAILAMTTPVAQFAKGNIQTIPIVYNVITDPVEAGLIPSHNQATHNLTGSADTQDITAMLKFATSVLPKAKTLGVLYATSESNDTALVKMLRAATHKLGMSIVAIPVEHARDVPTRMMQFKNKVDFIYVGTSGPIQPTLPAIAAAAHKMNIPVFNAQQQAVKDGLALASFGVSYAATGKNAATLVMQILNGKPVNQLTPMYPTQQDHVGFINKQLAIKYNANIPNNITVVE